MPIYEFYCRNCHTVYNFFARKVDTETIPACPSGKKCKLQRQMSRFAISRGLAESGQSADEVDDEKMEQAMMQMAGELEGMNEEDPQAIATMMRRLADTTGMNMGEGMEEAIRRMEAGEDPDKVEEEMGDILDAEEPFESGEGKLKGIARRLRDAPRIDEELYDL